MNTLARNKVLLSIIAFLLITNIVLVFLLLRDSRDHRHEEAKRPGFTERLKKEVGFTPEQMQVYEPKKKVFWDSMRSQFDEIKKTKEDFYSLMYNPSISDSVVQAKAEVIGHQQERLDLHVLRHFKDIRTLCTPEQLPRYDSLLPSIIERMTARQKR